MAAGNALAVAADLAAAGVTAVLALVGSTRHRDPAAFAIAGGGVAAYPRGVGIGGGKHAGNGNSGGQQHRHRGSTHRSLLGVRRDGVSRQGHLRQAARADVAAVACGCFRPGGRKHLLTKPPAHTLPAGPATPDSGAMNEDTTPQLLLVDDDVRLRELLQRYLESQGFSVRCAGNGSQMQQALDRGHYDLIVLDLMMPGESGLEICRRLRGQGDQTPVVMLTAKGDEVDRIVGLEIGADDYLPKPVSPRELLARIRAVLRRTRPVAAGAPLAQGGEVAFGRFRLQLASRELSRDGEPLQLTSGEFAVLSVLLRHPHQPLSRDRLMSLAHGREHQALERSIDVAVARLRKLLEDDPRNPRILQTVWGVGYVFVPPAGTEAAS